jgi:flagellar motor switch protein FliM
MPTLNSDEVDALMNAIREGEVPRADAGASSAGTVVAYDLTNQDRIIRGQMPTLDAINERAASVFGTSLAGRTRLDVRVTSAPAVLMKFADIMVLLAPPATVGILSLGQGNGVALMVLDGDLADTLLAAALGDRKARPELRAVPGRRDLTAVEKLVLQRLLSMLCDALSTAWHQVVPLRPEILRFESDSRLCNICPPSDMTILTTFEVTGAFQGRLHVVIPYAAVESVRKLLAAPPRPGSGSNDRFLTMLADEVLRVEVDLSVLLGEARVRLEQLIGFTVGDVIMLDTAEGEPIPVRVQNRPKMMGLPRVVAGGLAVEITQGITGPERAPTPAAPTAIPRNAA